MACQEHHADSWRGRLLLQHPDRRFAVEVLLETPDSSIAVTFFEHHQPE